MEDQNEIRTFADIGIPTKQATRETCCGQIRTFKSLNVCEIVFLVVSILALVGVLGITLQRLIVIDRHTADFTFASVLMFNIFFGFWYLSSGVFTERPSELVVFAGSTVTGWLYLVINYSVSRKGPYKTTRLIASSVFSPFIIILSLWLARKYHKSKNLIFRTVGANPALQDICQSVFLFLSLLKGDLQVCLSTAVLILTSGKSLGTEDYVLLPLVMISGILSYAAGYFSVQYEKKWLMLVFCTLWITVPAYAFFLIFVSAKDVLTTHAHMTYNKGAVWVTFVAATILLFLRVILLVYAQTVFFSFGKGLKEKVYDNAMEINFDRGNIHGGDAQRTSYGAVSIC